MYSMIRRREPRSSSSSTPTRWSRAASSARGQHRDHRHPQPRDDAFIILEDVTVEELGHRGETTKADYAQVNLDAVLFAVSTRRSR